MAEKELNNYSITGDNENPIDIGKDTDDIDEEIYNEDYGATNIDTENKDSEEISKKPILASSKSSAKKTIVKKKILKKIELPKVKPRVKTTTSKFHPKKQKKSIFLKYLLWAGIILAILVFSYYGLKTIPSLQFNDKGLLQVNNHKVTEKQLDNDYKFFFFINGYPEQYSQIITKELFLNQTIAQLLLYDEASKQGAELTTEEVKKEFDKSLEQSPISKEEFMEKLSENNFTYDQVIEYTKLQLTLLKFMNESLFNLVTVSDDETENFYTQNKAQFVREELVRAQHILLTTKEDADEVVQQLGKGANFSEIAKDKSIDPSAKVNLGDLGYFGRGQMVEEFEDVAFLLNPGKMTIIKTQFGYHVLQVLDKKQAGEIPYTEIRQEIKAQLLLEKQRKLVQDSVELLRQNAKINYY